jgi:hypothetical protein
VGCEARKIPAEGEVFFLDFYFYRTYQELARHCRSEIKISGGTQPILAAYAARG